MPFPETDIIIEEQLAFLLSREVRGGEITGVGTLSPVPLIGALLANRSHASSGKLFIFGDEGASIVDGSKELFDLAQRGKLGLFFLSGAQIDKRGNINLTCIGEYEAPKVRLPGGAGSGMLSYMSLRTVLFAMNHNRKIFVEDLDFTTTRGHDDYPWRIGGVTKVITPLCVLAYHPEKGRFDVESLQPGVSRDEVDDNTGFTLSHPDKSRVSPLPEEEDVRSMRTGVLDEVEKVYPRFVKTLRRKIERLGGDKTP